MKYKYNIKYKQSSGDIQVKNFKNRQSMIMFLDRNTQQVNKMNSPVLYFGSITLPLKQTVWYQPDQ